MGAVMIPLMILIADVGAVSAQVTDPTIVVTPATSDKGVVTHVQASIRVSAKPASVCTVITDCAPRRQKLFRTWKAAVRLNKIRPDDGMSAST